jgi:peptidyl-prolyl cis-trans isomerase D
MLDSLRAHKRGLLTWIIVGGIGLMFAISFGPGSLTRGNAGGCSGGQSVYAAKVNGKTIQPNEYERAYQQYYNLLAGQLGGSLPRELASQLGIEQRALDLVIDRELVVQEARSRGLDVTDQELAAALQSDPGFQTNGAFDRDLYRERASQIAGSAGRYEAQLAHEMLYRRMLAAVEHTVKISETEVRAEWLREADRAALSFVLFPRAAFEAEVKPTDAEVKAWGDQNGDAVKKMYEDDAARFDVKKKVRVRHVLARVGAGGEDAARKKIEDATARVKKGEDFAEVVKELSDDENTKGRGGELGFVTEGLFDEAFAKAALALEPGQVSEPVRSASGWHLIRAEEVVPAKKTPLDEARPIIARELLVKERALKAARARAEAALAAARGGKPLAQQFPADAADKKTKAVTVGGKAIVAQETGTFTAGTEQLPRVGAVPRLAADALAAERGAVLPKVYESPEGLVVATVVARERPDPAAFETASPAVRARLRQEAGMHVIGAWLKTLRDEARIEVNPALLAQGGPPPQP